MFLFRFPGKNSGNTMISLDLFLVLFSPIVKMGFHEIPWDVDFCTNRRAKRRIGNFIDPIKNAMRMSLDLAASSLFRRITLLATL